METYLTIEELAKYLKYAEKTIRKWVLNRQIPFHKIHKSIRFRLSEIDKWVDSGCVHESNEELGMRNEEYTEQLEMSKCQQSWQEQGVMSNGQ